MHKIYELSVPFFASLLRDIKIYKKFIGIIDIFDFDSIQPGLNQLIEFTRDFYLKYYKLPEKDYYKFRVENDNKLSPDIKVVLLRVIDNIFQIDLEKDGYKIDAFRDYMVKLLLEDILKTTSDKIKKDETFKVINNLHKEIQKIKGFYVEETYWDLIATFQEREMERKLRRENPYFERRLKLGIAKLDEQVEIVPGTITAFLAPYKRYKSITLTHVGWAALLQGFNVLHVQYEGRKQMWEARYDAKFTDLDYSKIVSYIRTQDEQKKIETIFQKLNSLKNRLFMMYAIPNVTNIDNISYVIDEIYLNHNVRIDVVIIDYFQIMGTTSKVLRGEEDWIIQGNIAWDLVNFANKPGDEKIVIGALQTKASALTVENLRSMHGGRSVIFQQAIDNMIAINQTEDEKREGVIRFSPLFLRDSEIKTEHCKVETELWKIKIAKEADKLWETLD